MLTKEIRGLLEKNQYRVVGEHSAVKICKWTKKSLRGEDVCWKEKFYDVKSHRCCQMSCWLACENSCLHCWLPLGFNLQTETKKIDKPKKIIEGVIKERKKLLSGFKSNKNINMKKFKEALEPSLFTFSLSGEPTLYPKLSELIKEIRKRKAISFLVTDGLNPKKIKELEKDALPTQLIVSLNAPNKELHKKLCRSSKKDAWKKLNETLEMMQKLKCRTVVRLTLIKELNMKKEHIGQYASLIKKANPLFVHAKGYVALGYSKEKLGEKRMPTHEEVKNYAKKLLKFLPEYKFLDEKIESRVVLLGKDKERTKIKEEEI